ncbi:MAG: hypothetical protein ABI550_01610, partial [Ignavibacteriaceae bacterium]
MVNLKEVLREYLDKLVHRFLFIRRLDDELKIINKWLYQKPDGMETLNLSASFFTAAQRGLDQTLLIELCKFIDQDEKKSLNNWMIKAKEHVIPLEPTYYDRNSGKRLKMKKKDFVSLVDSQMTELRKQSKTIRNLKARRNKVLAYTDAAFFNDPRNLRIKYPLFTSDIDELLETVRGILRKFCVPMFEADYDLSTVHTIYSLDTILTYARAFMWANDDKEL